MASTLIDGLVLLVAVIAAGSVLHWAWRRLRSTPAALVLGLLIASQAIAPGAASAAVTAFERQRYILPAGEIVDNDLIVGAERIRIEGVVTGDLIVAARFVDVSGEVKGDVLGFAEQIEVTGEVGGSVRTASRVLDIEGRVERNITSAGETIRLQPGGALSGSFTAAARHVILDAPVDRDILVAAEIQEIGARVGGSAVMAGRRLAIGPNAAIAGEATFYGAEEPEVSPGAELASPLEFERIEEEEPSALGRVGNFVYFWAAAFLLGAAVMLLAPEATEEILTVHLPRYGRSLITGLLSLLVVLALSILLFVTLVGVPLALTALFVWSFGVYAAQAYVGAYIGREVLGPPTNPSQAMGRLALGLLLIHLAKQIPFVGEIVTVVVAIWGFGGFTLWALRHVPKTTVVPPAPAEAS